MTSALVFVLGLILGSFSNAVIWRLGTKKSIVWDRSECTYCGHKLSSLDLIPVLGFLALKGRCRYCSKKISWQYPLVELALALGWWQIRLLPISGAERVWLAGIFWIALLIFVYDLKHMLIPNVFVAIGIAWVVAGVLFLHRTDFWYSFFSGSAVFFFFYLMHIFSQGRWIGGGDAKLGFFLGFWLSYPFAFLGLLFSYIIGAVVGLGLIAFKNISLKSRIPFGPFLIIGFWSAYLWGNKIIDWYVQLFF